MRHIVIKHSKSLSQWVQFKLKTKGVKEHLTIHQPTLQRSLDCIIFVLLLDETLYQPSCPRVSLIVSIQRKMFLTENRFLTSFSSGPMQLLHNMQSLRAPRLKWDTSFNLARVNNVLLNRRYKKSGLEFAKRLRLWSWRVSIETRLPRKSNSIFYSPQNCFQQIRFHQILLRSCLSTKFESIRLVE